MPRILCADGSSQWVPYPGQFSAGFIALMLVLVASLGQLDGYERSPAHAWGPAMFIIAGLLVVGLLLGYFRPWPRTMEELKKMDDEFLGGLRPVYPERHLHTETDMVPTVEQRKQALVECFDADPLAIEHVRGHNFRIGTEKYEVLTEVEADLIVKEKVEDSLWSMRPEFLVGHLSLDGSGFGNPDVVKSVRKVQELRESSNDLLKAAVKDLDFLVKEVVASDGRGHYLSPYDGVENEERVFLKTEAGVVTGHIDFLIYRQN